MKRSFKYLVPCLLSVTMLASCFKDEGNYDYKELVPIEIDEATIPKAIVRKQHEYLTINPTVSQGGSDANLAYEWRLKDDLWVPDPTTGEFIDEVIGTEKNLNFLLDVPARSYHLMYYVTDKTNGTTETWQIALTVQTIAPQGWMVMSGYGGTSDVSIVINPYVNASIEGFEGDAVTHGIFSANNEGRRAGGEPAFIAHARGGGDNSVYVFTKGEGGGYRTSAADLKIAGDYSTNFRNMPASEVSFEGYNRWLTNELIVNNGDLYFCPQNDPVSFVPFGVKCFGMDYHASPFIGTHAGGNVYGAFYDTRNKRFLYINYQQTVLAFNPPASGTFDMNDVGKDIVYGEMGYPANFWHCIMQDGNDPSTRQIYVVDLNKYTWEQTSAHGSEIIDIGAATAMAGSKYFAFGARGYVMYHATETGVYFNNYKGDRSSSLIYDVSQEYPGYEITHIQIYKHDSNPDYDSKLLFVGIYDPATGSGELLQFLVNETNGSFEESSPTVYSGFGKIGSMNYKRR